MVEYLTEEDIRRLNRRSLEVSGELSNNVVVQPDDIRFVIRYVSTHVQDDPFQQATAYCISLITLHPFKNGNHRTSLLSADLFLQKNNFIYSGTDKDRIALEKWRLTYEEEHELHREFFRITNLESAKERIREIERLIDSPYGKEIKRWLQKHYASEPSRKT